MIKKKKNTFYGKITSYAETEKLTVVKCYGKLAKGLWDGLMLLLFGSIGILGLSVAMPVSMDVVFSIIKWLACSVLFYFLALLLFFIICQITISINDFIKK